MAASFERMMEVSFHCERSKRKFKGPTARKPRRRDRYRRRDSMAAVGCSEGRVETLSGLLRLDGDLGLFQPSLRGANGSRECALDDRLRAVNLDCFASLAMTAESIIDVRGISAAAFPCA
jgi:hypothetical protein